MSNAHQSASLDATPNFITPKQIASIRSEMEMATRYFKNHQDTASRRIYNRLRDKYGYTSLKTMPKSVYPYVLRSIRRIGKDSHDFWLHQFDIELMFLNKMEQSLK